VSLFSSQALRVLTLEPSLGPLVLMVLRMITQDLLQWLVLLVVAFLAPFVAGFVVLFKRADVAADNDDDCNGLVEARPLSIGFALFEMILGGGDGKVDCLQSAGYSGVVVATLQAYLVLTVVLLLNLLIALLSKTFDVVYENLTLNYQYLFARLVVTTEESLILPPPFNLVGMPCQLTLWLVRRCWRRCGQRQGQHGFSLLPETEADDGAPSSSDDLNLTQFRSQEGKWTDRYPLHECKEDNPRLDAFVTEINTFLHEQQGAQVQEERWRAQFSRSVRTGFDAQDNKVNALRNDNEALRNDVRALNDKLDLLVSGLLKQQSGPSEAVGTSPSKRGKQAASAPLTA